MRSFVPARDDAMATGGCLLSATPPTPLLSPPPSPAGIHYPFDNEKPRAQSGAFPFPFKPPSPPPETSRRRRSRQRGVAASRSSAATKGRIYRGTRAAAAASFIRACDAGPCPCLSSGDGNGSLTQPCSSESRGLCVGSASAPAAPFALSSLGADEASTEPLSR